MKRAHTQGLEACGGTITHGCTPTADRRQTCKDGEEHGTDASEDTVVRRRLKEASRNMPQIKKSVCCAKGK